MTDFEQGDSEKADSEKADFEKTDFEKKVQASLNSNLDNLDANTYTQLAAARYKALNQATKKSGFSLLWLNSLNKNYWLSAGSLALCSLLAVFILVNPQSNNSHPNVANNLAQQQSTDQVAALELLNDAEDSDGDEMADPDFYLWADEIIAAESRQYAV